MTGRLLTQSTLSGRRASIEKTSLPDHRVYCTNECRVGREEVWKGEHNIQLSDG